MSGEKVAEKAPAGRTTRLRDFLLGFVLRPLVFAFWAFVIWGTFLAILFVLRVLSAGWAAAVTSLWPDPEASAWAFMNLVCLGLAALVWTLAGVLLAVRRRTSDSQPS